MCSVLKLAIFVHLLIHTLMDTNCNNLVLITVMNIATEPFRRHISHSI